MDTYEKTRSAISKVSATIDVLLESVDLDSLTKDEYNNVEKFCDEIVEKLDDIKENMSLKSEDNADSENEDT